MDIYKEALLLHKDKVGKIDIISKVKTENEHDLSLAYSPGVATSVAAAAVATGVAPADTDLDWIEYKAKNILRK